MTRVVKEVKDVLANGLGPFIGSNMIASKSRDNRFFDQKVFFPAGKNIFIVGIIISSKYYIDPENMTP